MKLKLKIINLEGVYFDGEVDLLNITIASGNVTILANHLPLISNIEICHMYTKNNGVIENYAIAGGTLFVTEKECKVITTAIEKESEIDYERALKAKERAMGRIKSNQADVARAEVALKRAINRLSMK